MKAACPQAGFLETLALLKAMGRWRLNPPAHDFIETG